ncbi:MAG TPA: hypothetical protein VGN16_21925 [Acidobacteriaceae bacterium]
MAVIPLAFPVNVVSGTGGAEATFSVAENGFEAAAGQDRNDLNFTGNENIFAAVRASPRAPLLVPLGI